VVALLFRPHVRALRQVSALKLFYFELAFIKYSQ